MNLSQYQEYLLPALIVSFFAYRFIKTKGVKKMIPKLIKEGAIVVDVRSPAEFSQCCRPGSLNIPVQEIPMRLKELDKNKTIILCCASGGRSGMAAGILTANGFKNVINAGPWQNTLTEE